MASFAVKCYQLQECKTCIVTNRVWQKVNLAFLRGGLGMTKELKCDIQRLQQNILTVTAKTNEAAVQTSFIILNNISKRERVKKT